MQSLFFTGLASLMLLGILLILSGILLLRTARVKTILLKSKSVRRLGMLDRIINKFAFIKKIEARAETAIFVYDIKGLTPRKYTKFSIVLGVLGLCIAVVLNNALVAPLLILILCYIPFAFFERVKKIKSMSYNAQVLEFLQEFVTDYTTTKSVQMTLENTVIKIKRPLRNEYERLLRAINSGVPYRDCLLAFANRTHNHWIMLFAQVMIMYFRNGGDFVPHLTSVIRTMAAERLVEEQNTTELTALKTINMVLIILVPVTYMITISLAPDTARVFTQTATGRFIVFGAVTACLFSIVAGKWIIDS